MPPSHCLPSQFARFKLLSPPLPPNNRPHQQPHPRASPTTQTSDRAKRLSFAIMQSRVAIMQTRVAIMQSRVGWRQSPRHNAAFAGWLPRHNAALAGVVDGRSPSRKCSHPPKRRIAQNACPLQSRVGWRARRPPERRIAQKAGLLSHNSRAGWCGRRPPNLVGLRKSLVLMHDQPRRIAQRLGQLTAPTPAAHHLLCRLTVSFVILQSR